MFLFADIAWEDTLELIYNIAVALKCNFIYIPSLIFPFEILIFAPRRNLSITSSVEFSSNYRDVIFFVLKYWTSITAVPKNCWQQKLLLYHRMLALCGLKKN